MIDVFRCHFQKVIVRSRDRNALDDPGRFPDCFHKCIGVRFGPLVQVGVRSLDVEEVEFLEGSKRVRWTLGKRCSAPVTSNSGVAPIDAGSVPVTET